MSERNHLQKKYFDTPMHLKFFDNYNFGVLLSKADISIRSLMPILQFQSIIVNFIWLFYSLLLKTNF